MIKKEEVKPQAATADPPQTKYSIEKLRENCLKLFGISQSTFDGASYGLTGKYTVAEMKSVITKWQNKEVK